METKRLAILALLLACASYALLQGQAPAAEESVEIPMLLAVGDRIGFDAGNSSLSYGTVPREASIERSVVLRNTKDHAQRFLVEASGDLASWTNVSERDFVLEAGGNRTVNVLIKVPQDAAYGSYTGTMLIQMRRSG